MKWLAYSRLTVRFFSEIVLNILPVTDDGYAVTFYQVT